MQTRQLNKIRRLVEAATRAAINYGYAMGTDDALARTQGNPFTAKSDWSYKRRRRAMLRMDGADRKVHRYLSSLQNRKVAK